MEPTSMKLCKSDNFARSKKNLTLRIKHYFESNIEPGKSKVIQSSSKSNVAK